MWCPDTLLKSACFQLSVFSEPAGVCVFVSQKYLQSLIGIHISFPVCARLWQRSPRVLKCLLLCLVPSSIADDPSSFIENKSDLSVPFSPFLPVNGIPKSRHCSCLSVAAAACFGHPCFLLWPFPDEGPELVCCVEGQACHWWLFQERGCVSKGTLWAKVYPPTGTPAISPSWAPLFQEIPIKVLRTSFVIFNP